MSHITCCYIFQKRKSFRGMSADSADSTRIPQGMGGECKVLNNSLKRVKSSVRGQEERPDSREVISDRWLSAAEVNKFKDETQDTVSIIQYNWTKALIICETGV